MGWMAGPSPSRTAPDPPQPLGVGSVPVGTITLELTHRCHRRCDFCYVPDLERPDGPGEAELPAADMVALTSELMGATGCQDVQLSSGEPLLRDDLLPIIEGLTGGGATVSIITDGAQLDAPLARELAARGVRKVQPTLLSGDARIHDSLRGRGAFGAATGAIAAGAAAGLEMIVCMVITRRNWEEAGRVAELAFALGARGLALSRFCPAGAAVRAHAALMPTAEQVREAATVATRACRALSLPVATAVTIPPCVWERPDLPPLRVGRCSLVGPRCTVTVGPDGGVRSCSLSTTEVGKLGDEPWEVLAQRLWDRYLEPARITRPHACRSCHLWKQCYGGCRLSGLTVHGGFDQPDPLAPIRRG